MKNKNILKKIATYSLLALNIIGLKAQVPIHHFSFDNTISNQTNTISFNTTVAGTNYFYTNGESGASNTAVGLTSVPFRADIPNLPQGNSPRTVMVRVISAYGNYENPIFSYGTASNNQAFGLSHIDGSQSTGNYLDNKLRVFTYGAGNSFETNGVGITNPKWYLLTLTYDGTVLKLYKNTQLLLTQTINLNTVGTAFFLNSVVGAQPNGSNHITVDDLKIYNVALTPQQIASNYVNGANFNTGLLAFYDFENNLDSFTGNHNLIASGGNPNYYVGIEGGASKAAAFEGANIAYNTSLDAVFNNTEYTVAFWEWRFNSTVYNSYDTTIELFGSHYARRDVNRFYKVGLSYNNGQWFSELPGTSVIGTWLHHAFVFKRNTSTNKTELIHYENGVSVGNPSVVTGMQSLYHYNNKFTVGGGTDSMGNFQSNKYGRIKLDKLFIYSKALTDKEINVMKDLHQEVFSLSTLSTNDGFNEEKQIQIFPNPAKDFINIQFDGKIKSVEIYNLQGQKLITATQKQINISSLSSGVYLMHIQSMDGKIIAKKIVKE